MTAISQPEFAIEHVEIRCACRGVGFRDFLRFVVKIRKVPAILLSKEHHFFWRIIRVVFNIVRVDRYKSDTTFLILRGDARERCGNMDDERTMVANECNDETMRPPNVVKAVQRARAVDQRELGCVVTGFQSHRGWNFSHNTLSIIDLTDIATPEHSRYNRAVSQHYILALDQGTTSSRAIVFDRDGRPVAIAQKEHRQIYPQAGWVEHDATEIWNNQLAVAEEALVLAGLQAREIAAIGITNQRETVVLWDRVTGKPLCNAIVWQDRRTTTLCQQMQGAGLEPEFTNRTGLRLDPYFSGTKLRWLLDHIDGARERAEAGELCFGTVDSWLVWNLTGGKAHVTDASNASRTLLCDLRSTEWSDWCLDQLQIPHPLLPEIVDSSGVIAEATAGNLAGIPIAGIAGDQQAALFGQACFEAGMAKNTYGTGCFLLLHTGSEPKAADHLLSTVAWRMNGATEYALEGSVFIGGAVVQWLRDELQLIASAEECSTFAAEVEHSNGVFLVPAFAGLGAPHWDPHARGSMFGLTGGANRGHICRTALESIAFQSTDLIHAMEQTASIKLAELRVDGGATNSDLLMQIQADILQAEVVRPACIETTALGAAYLAGLATGVWPDKETIAQQWRVARRFTPMTDPARSADQLRNWHRAVERSKLWVQES